MPRSKRVFKKRSGVSKKPVNATLNLPDESVIEVPCAQVRPSDVPISSSKKKLKQVGLPNDQYSDYINSCEGTEYQVIDINILSDALIDFVMCKYCVQDKCVKIICANDKQTGLACSLQLICQNCDQTFDFISSKKTDKYYYDINIRLVYGLRCIGKGQKAGNLLCSVMNLPKPPSKFYTYSNFLKCAVKHVAEESMNAAAEEAIVLNNGSSDLSAALDGTWQKRGHTSLNGVISVTSVDNGKVLDVHCLTKYCQGCTMSNADKNLPSKHDNNCVVNYQGNSGGMEVVGAVTVFSRSIQDRGVRYVQYLGDGDSKGFKKVLESKPYGENFDIVKLECIGHVQKRMGSRLRKLKRDFKGKRLSDGKFLGGKNRLTDSDIDLLQTYYGLAIRRNTDDLTRMKQAIWASYFHKLSTDEKPQHGLCPKGPESWCQYNRAQETGEQYKHNKSLPEAVMESIKPIYRSLSDSDLLKKCLHGKTQNPNESFNNVIWERLPKTTFVGLNTLELGTYDAVISFNDGNVGRLKVLQKLGIDPGLNTINGLRELDIYRLKKADMAVQNMQKASRQHKRNIRRRLDDDQNEENPDYGAGQF